MKRVALVSLAVLLVATVVPAVALAKGASEAAIVGPGLDDPIILKGGLNGPGQLADAAGFFPAVFMRTPDPMLAQRPKSDLGPRYTITYVMPNPYNELDRLRQDLYPYATPGPVTYVEPGQPFFGTERTHGGWYVASALLKDELVALGLPAVPPRLGPEGTEFPWALVGVLALAGAALGLAALAVLLIRRRPRPATTA